MGDNSDVNTGRKERRSLLPLVPTHIGPLTRAWA